jgi:hypothetical protein
VDFAIVGKLAQTVFPDGVLAVHSKPKLSILLGYGESWAISFLFLDACMKPLVCTPRTKLGVFAVLCGNIAVPVDFAIVGKLAQTVFPGGVVFHSKPKLSIPGYGGGHRRFLSF